MNKQLENKLRKLIRNEIKNAILEISKTESEKSYTFEFKNGEKHTKFISYSGMMAYIDKNLHRMKFVYESDKLVWAWLGSSEFK